MTDGRIMVVDDEQFIARALSFILTKEGYQVVTAADGEEALVKIAENKPRMMYLDIMMPKKNGYEVCEIIKKDPNLKDIYIIVLSAKGYEADKQKALSFGADDFISKPFNPPEIVSRTKTVMASLSQTPG